VVAYYGSAAGPGLGVLGAAPPDLIAARIKAAAAPFSTAGRPVQPTMELIVTVATAGPGPEGTYSVPLAPETVASYHAAARRQHLLLLLDLQPGQADFLTQARRYERFLREPDVGLALDPEWSMDPGQRPGQVIGHTDAATVNGVSDWLAGLVRRHGLPQKLLVIHQFTVSMVTARQQVLARPELATVFHVDGFGTPRAKIEKYALLHGQPPLFNGLKLFYRQDVGLMSPAAVMALRPRPDLVTYQ
jgi:hypothetical protein